MNSELLHDPSLVPDEGARHLRFIEDSLLSAEARTARHRVVFMHRPPFVGEPDDDHPQVLAPGARQRLVRLFDDTQVGTVMAGHWHRELRSRHRELEVVVTSAIGFPLDGLAGYRTVRVDGNRVTHSLHSLEDVR